MCFHITFLPAGECQKAKANVRRAFVKPKHICQPREQVGSGSASSRGLEISLALLSSGNAAYEPLVGPAGGWAKDEEMRVAGMCWETGVDEQMGPLQCKHPEYLPGICPYEVPYVSVTLGTIMWGKLHTAQF